MKSCAKSKGVDTVKLVQLLRESNENSSAVDIGPSSLRLEEDKEEHVQTRRSRRLATQSKTLQPSGNERQGIEDDDFTMPMPPGPPARRGRKRKRENLQDKYRFFLYSTPEV